MMYSVDSGGAIEMLKRIDIKILIFSALLIVIAEVVMAMLLPKMGAGAYIIGELLLVAFIFFIAGLVSKDVNKFWFTGIVLVAACAAIQISFGLSDFGKNTYELLNNMSVSETVQTQDVEVSFSDGNVASQILNYVFYFVIYVIGGRIKKAKLKFASDRT